MGNQYTNYNKPFRFKYTWIRKANVPSGLSKSTRREVLLYHHTEYVLSEEGKAFISKIQGPMLSSRSPACTGPVSLTCSTECYSTEATGLESDPLLIHARRGFGAGVKQ